MLPLFNGGIRIQVVSTDIPYGGTDTGNLSRKVSPWDLSSHRWGVGLLVLHVPKNSLFSIKYP